MSDHALRIAAGSPEAPAEPTPPEPMAPEPMPPESLAPEFVATVMVTGRPARARPRRWPVAAAVALALLLCVAGCDRQPASQRSPTGTREAAPKAAAAPQRNAQKIKPTANEAAELDPVVGTVDDAPIRLSWVRRRLAQAEAELSDGEAVATALHAAAADVICLREFAVLKLTPKAGESPQAAVDRLLAGTWPAHAGCRVDDADLKLAYLSAPSRWRHPTALTLWEAELVCCPGGCRGPERSAELDRCHRRAEGTAKALHAALQAALPPPLAVTRATLNDSPARAQHLPAFERAVAAFAAGVQARNGGAPAGARPQEITPRLLRYTAFARERAFRKLAFRRTDPALERAALPLPIGGLTPPVRTDSGWSMALVVGHEPPLHGSLRDPTTRRGLRAEVCQQQAAGQRAAYRDRMLRHAKLVWWREVIKRELGAAAEAALPQTAQPQTPEPKTAR